MDFPLLHLTTRGYLFQDLTHICNLQFIGGGQQKKENRSQDWSSIFYLRLWRENDESNSSLDFPELKPSVCSFFCEKNKKTPFHPLIDHHVPYPKKTAMKIYSLNQYLMCIYVYILYVLVYRCICIYVTCIYNIIYIYRCIC